MEGLGLRIDGFTFQRLRASGFRIRGFRVQDLRFRVQR